MGETQQNRKLECLIVLASDEKCSNFYGNLQKDEKESENGLFCVDSVVFADAAERPVAVAARLQEDEEAAALHAVCLRETAEHAGTEGPQCGSARQESDGM